MKNDYKFKIQKATAQLTMDHPFVSAILLKHPIKERSDIPTLAVDGRGQIYYNPKFIDTLSVPQVVWGLAHEVFHRIGQHALLRHRGALLGSEHHDERVVVLELAVEPGGRQPLRLRGTLLFGCTSADRHERDRHRHHRQRRSHGSSIGENPHDPNPSRRAMMTFMISLVPA